MYVSGERIETARRPGPGAYQPDRFKGRARHRTRCAPDAVLPGADQYRWLALSPRPGFAGWIIAVTSG